MGWSFLPTPNLSPDDLADWGPFDAIAYYHLRGTPRFALLGHHHVRLMTRRPCEATIHGHERRIERLGKGHVERVVRGEVLPKLPHPTEEGRVRVMHDPQRLQIVQGFLGTRRRQNRGPLQPPEDLCDFDIEKVRHVEGLSLRQEEVRKPLVRLAAQEQLHRRRGIDDDQRSALAARTASPELSPSRTRDRRSSRSRIWAGVGRSAASRSSTRR